MEACAGRILEIAAKGGDLSSAPLQYPAFPEPGATPGLTGEMIPTYTYNWCVSPLTPMAVAGVIWIPSPANIGSEPALYGEELEAYARSLPGTYGQKAVPFLYAQPSATLVKGITAPTIPNAKAVSFDTWPKSLRDMAAAMARLAK